MDGCRLRLTQQHGQPGQTPAAAGNAQNRLIAAGGHHLRRHQNARRQEARAAANEASSSAKTRLLRTAAAMLDTPVISGRRNSIDRSAEPFSQLIVSGMGMTQV